MKTSFKNHKDNFDFTGLGVELGIRSYLYDAVALIAYGKLDDGVLAKCIRIGNFEDQYIMVIDLNIVMNPKSVEGYIPDFIMEMARKTGRNIQALLMYFIAQSVNWGHTDPSEPFIFSYDCLKDCYASQVIWYEIFCYLDKILLMRKRKALNEGGAQILNETSETAN